MPAKKKTTKSKKPAKVDAPALELPPKELIVVARPESALRATPAGLSSATASDTRSIASLLSRAKATMVPLFGGPEERIATASAFAASTGNFVPDLSVFYQIQAEEEQLEDLAAALADDDLVEAAYVKPPAEVPDVNDMAPLPEEAPPASPDYTSRQGYLNAAPEGIDARHAWTVRGGSGKGVRIIDIEGAWRFTHEDLVQNQGGVVLGTPSSDIRWRNHGTAVIGEFGGDRNSFGVTGICPDANTRAISIFGGVGSAGAIGDAADLLRAGDILLIELHRPGPRHNFQSRADQLGYVAIEWWPDDLAAIQYAVGRGVIVVEAAGNGAENLDDGLYNTPQTGFPPTWQNPYPRNPVDSGAILVGAGAPPPGTHGRDHGPDRSRLGFSNYARAVDAQGWGREVTTCGYGNLQGGSNEDIWYTDTFSGTSSASPIVVGALGCIQGALKRAGQSTRTPAQARQLLRSTGSPQQAAPGRPTSQRIGNRPDLRQAFSSLGLGGITKLKEIKEFKEKDRKELKEKDRKEIKELKEKDRKEFKEKDRKEFKEKDKDIFEGFGRPTEGESSIEDRLASLENTMGSLTHFISSNLRPDLDESSLANEFDSPSGEGSDLDVQERAAKDYKDQKDTETGNY